MIKHSPTTTSVNTTSHKILNSYANLNNTIPIINGPTNGHTNTSEYEMKANEKNGQRSSSLPLKIMLNGGKNGSAEKIIKSWNGNSTLVNKCVDNLHNNDCKGNHGQHTNQYKNGPSIFLTYKYNHLSLSEHFLNLIQEKNLENSLNSLKKNKLIKLNYAINKSDLIKDYPKLSFSNNNNNSNQINLNKQIAIRTQKLEEAAAEIPEVVAASVQNDLNENREKAKEKEEIKKVDTTNEINKNDKTTHTEETNLIKENHLIKETNAILLDDVLREVSVCLDALLAKVVDSSLEETISMNSTCNNSNKSNSETEKTTNLDEQSKAQLEFDSTNPEVASSSSDLPLELNETASQTATDNKLTVRIEKCQENTSSLESSSLNSTENSSGIYSGSDEASSTNLIKTRNDLDSSVNNDSLTILEDNLANVDNETCQYLEDDFSQSSSCEEEELEYRKFLPKKSCLASKSKLFIDITCVGDSTGLSNDPETSSPLIPTTPVSPSSHHSSTFSSSSINTTTTDDSSSNPGNSTKKRVFFADTCGKELFTVRTMSEPSNCPPKLTSKIVQYFLNREFDYKSSSNGFSASNSGEFSNYANGISQQAQNLHETLMQNQPNSFFSSNRNYDYGISGFNYSNDSSAHNLSGSIAFYSLNFAQPAADYFNFKKRLDNNFVSLENVLLNSFKINGTIKVKNNNFHKYVFLRCSFNGWSSYEDIQTQFVSYDFYSSPNSTSLFFGGTNYHEIANPQHKEYDTFRFEFQLPKTVKSTIDSNNINNSNNITASIQFCICYRSGAGSETREYWDSNEGKNYEILQYVIDLEQKKPSNTKQSNNSNHRQQKASSSIFKFDINNYKGNPSKSLVNNNNIGTSSTSYMPSEEIYY